MWIFAWHIKKGHYLRSPRMHWSVDVRILSDNFVLYLVPTKNHAGPNPHDIDAVRERSPEKLMCFTLWHFSRSTAFLSPWRCQFQFANLYMWEGRGRLTCETTYVNNVTLRYVTFWYLSLRRVTMRYVTDAAWGFFHDTCKRGYYSRCQRMQQGRSDNVIFFMLTTWSSNSFLQSFTRAPPYFFDFET